MASRPLLSDEELNLGAAAARQAQSAQISRNVVAAGNPQQARSDYRLGRESGIPALALDAGTRPIAETRRQQTWAEEALARAPNLIPVFANPERYGRVSDDVRQLASVAEAAGRSGVDHVQPGGSFGARLRSSGALSAIAASVRDTLAAAGSAAGEGLAGLARGAIENLPNAVPGLSAIRDPHFIAAAGYDPIGIAASGAQSVGDYYAAARRSRQVDYGHWFPNAAARGIESIPLQVAALVAASRGNPAGAVAILSGISGGQSYSEARNEGLGVAEATRYGLTQGGLEAMGESLPVFAFAGDVARGAGLFRTLRGQLWRENLGEQFTQHAQDFNRWASIEANQGRPFTDFLAERPQVILETAIATTAATGVQTTAAHALTRAADRYVEAQAAREESRRLDRIMEASAESVTRRESPDDFREIMAEVTSDKLYVPPEAIRSLFQDAPDDLSRDDFWGRYVDEIAEAEAIGGDVVIPLSEAATSLAGSPQWQAIRDQVRTSPGGFSRAETDEANAEFETAIRESGAQLEQELSAERERLAPVQRVFEAMRDKLMIAGIAAEPAQQLATLYAQRQATRAERMGRALTGDEGLSVEVRAAENEEAGPGRVLTHSFRDGPRGRITFKAEGPATIDLFENRNLSTAIHEFGHFFLEELRDDAGQATTEDADGARQVFADWGALQAWFKREGHEMGADGTIPTGAHELFARSFERFAMEGRAPSASLRRAFEAFKSWLITIYRTISRLRAPITPEIRDILARLVATDEEIAAAAETEQIKALFETPEQAAEFGMTPAAFADYQRLSEAAREDANDGLLRRVMATVRAARTKEWRDREGGVRAEAAAAIDEQPVFRALRLLRTGKLGDEEARRVRLDRAWLVETYGEEGIARLPKAVPPIMAETDTMPADEIAEMTGFASGDELVRTLMGHEDTRRQLREQGDKRSPRQVLIDEAVAANMAERYGDPLRDGSIEEEAREIVRNDRQGDRLAAELRGLASRANRRATPYSVAREWAAEKVASSRVVDVTSGQALQQYLRAARRAAKAASDAMIARDYDEAFKQKQSEMLNNALVAEGRKAKEKVETAVARMGKIARRRTITSVDQDYLDQAHDLLEAVEFQTRSQRSLDKQASFEEWAEAQRAKGHDIVVPPSFAASIGRQHWSRLTVDEIKGLDAAVSQVIHLGRLKQTLLDKGERVAFDQVVAEAVSGAGGLRQIPPSDNLTPSFAESLKSKVASFDAALLKIETLVDWLDGGKADGVFNRVVFRPMAEAQAKAADMYTDYIGRLNDALAAVPAKTLRRWNDRVTIPELLNRETGNPFTLTRQQLVSMALNMGNAGNAQRLADGYGWNEEQILAALNRELTADEWAYAQSVWDIIDGLWPQIEALERNINGIAPDKVEARPIETPHGTFRGGYYPAVYDSARDYDAEKNAARETDLFETLYTRATTRASSTKERADQVSRPILLNLGVINRHVGEVIHDVTHREPVMNADKFLSSRRVMRAMDGAIGQESRKQFRPWLKHVANQWASERAGNEGIAAFIGKLRANTTIVGMGWRASTVMMQIAGYSNSFEVVGARWVGPAVAQVAKNPAEAFRFVMERSDEIRHRMDTLDRDIAQGIARLAGRTNPLSAAKRFAFHGIGYMDRIVVIPTWLGAYNKALAGGVTETDAAYAADKAVRQSQGAAGAKDVAAVARGGGKWGEALRLMTMFYSYVSAVYQRQRTLGRDIRGAKASDIPNIAARAWWLIVVPPILSELIAGRGPGEDEDWGWWSFRNMLFQALGAIPVVRDVARPAWDKAVGNPGFGYRLTPLQGAGESVVNVAGDVGDAFRGDDTTRATRNTLEAVGYATGLVPGQVAQATQFLVNVGYGDARPEDLGDWWEGLTTGRLSEG